MLMRDFNKESLSMLSEIGDYSRQTLLTTLGGELNHTLQQQLGEIDLPSAKEVWRWIKTII